MIIQVRQRDLRGFCARLGDDRPGFDVRRVDAGERGEGEGEPAATHGSAEDEVKGHRGVAGDIEEADEISVGGGLVELAVTVERDLPLPPRVRGADLYRHPHPIDEQGVGPVRRAGDGSEADVVEFAPDFVHNIGRGERWHG